MLSKSTEFLTCELLIAPKRRDNILAQEFAMLMGADTIPQKLAFAEFMVYAF